MDAAQRVRKRFSLVTSAQRTYLLPFIAVEVVLAALVGTLAMIVHDNKGPLPGDEGLILGVQQAIGPKSMLANIINVDSNLNWPLGAGIGVGIAVVGLLLFRRWLEAALVFLVKYLSDLCNFYINQFVQRPRPSAPGLYVDRQVGTSYSFPSGHFTHAVAFFGFLLYLSFQIPNASRWLWLPRAVLIAAIVLMPVSRLLQGEHWPTDLLESLFNGGFWLILAIVVHRWAREHLPQIIENLKHKVAHARS